MTFRFVAALAAALVAAVAAPSARADMKEILDKGVLRIGTQMDNPPFGFVDPQGKPSGFDIELGEMIGKALGVKVQVEQIIGANRIPFLLTNKIDLVVSGMGSTPERAVQVMFTAPYANAYLGVYGSKSTAITSHTQLGQLKVSSVKGTTQDITLTALAPNANIVRYDDDATSRTSFLAGQTDLWATLSTLAIDIAKRNPEKQIELKFKLRNSPAHMAVRQGDYGMMQWLNNYIWVIKQNGELERLHQKWLGDTMGELTTF